MIIFVFFKCYFFLSPKFFLFPEFGLQSDWCRYPIWNQIISMKWHFGLTVLDGGSLTRWSEIGSPFKNTLFTTILTCWSKCWIEVYLVIEFYVLKKSFAFVDQYLISKYFKISLTHHFSTVFLLNSICYSISNAAVAFFIHPFSMLLHTPTC